MLGTQLIGYPARRFDGVEVGAQLADTSVAGIASGFAVGPFLGYKWITRIRFTALVLSGVQFLAVRANAKDDAGNGASASDSRIGPLLNLDVDWSF